VGTQVTRVTDVQIIALVSLSTALPLVLHAVAIVLREMSRLRREKRYLIEARADAARATQPKRGIGFSLP
jgi:hypothetical protein